MEAGAGWRTLLRYAEVSVWHASSPARGTARRTREQVEEFDAIPSVYQPLATTKSGILLGLAACMLSSLQPVEAAGPSNKVAYVTDFGTGVNDTTAPGGSSIFTNAILAHPPAGDDYTTPSGTVTHFTDVPVSTIDSGGVGALANFDTVMLYEVCDFDAHPNLVSALNTYLANGSGKVVIYDADRCAANEANRIPNYSSFLFPFTTNNPGALAANGSVTRVEPEAPPATLTRGISTGQFSEAVGDANTFTSNTGGWCAAIEGTNANRVTGIQVAYARTPNGGLAIYDGQDNYALLSQPNPFDKTVFDNILDQPFNPDALPCSIPASGISLSPASTTNPVGGSHTVTATVSTSSGAPVAGVSVTFAIQSGPNAGKSGTAATASNGQASFTYTDTGGAGTDDITASFKDPTGATHTSNTVTKTWTAGVVDTTPPTCKLTAALAGPPKQIQITVQDADGGLKSIVATATTNATVNIPPFTAGTTSPVVVTATKVNQALSSSVTLRATDQAGNVTTCDPALVSVGREAGEHPVQVLQHMAGAESHVTIANGTPGVKSLRLVVNGHSFEVAHLQDGETRRVDVSSAMRQGSDNALLIVAHGPRDSSAVVVVSDA